MANSTITVKLLDGVEVKLASNSPDLNGLVQAIVAKRNEIDPEKIKVECDDSKFDCEGFVGIISTATKSFLEELRIDKQKLDAALKEIQERDCKQA